MEKSRYVAPKLRRITDPAELARVAALMLSDGESINGHNFREAAARGLNTYRKRGAVIDALFWSVVISYYESELDNANKRASIWKRVAKRIWTRCVPDTVGRYGSAARDIRMRRHMR